MGTRGVTLVALVLVLAFLRTEARAEPQKRTERYGWHIARIDVVTVGMIAGGLAIAVHGDESKTRFGGGALAFAGTLFWSFTPAAVHAAHGNGSAASASPILRPAMPLGAIMVAGTLYEICECGSEDTWLFASVGAGAAGAMAIDYFVLAQLDVPVTPAVAPANGGAVLGIRATF